MLQVTWSLFALVLVQLEELFIATQEGLGLNPVYRNNYRIFMDHLV